MRPSITPNDLRRKRTPATELDIDMFESLELAALREQREKRAIEVLEACETALRNAKDDGATIVDFDDPEGTTEASGVLGDHGWFVSSKVLKSGKVRMVIRELVDDPKKMADTYKSDLDDDDEMSDEVKVIGRTFGSIP